MAGALAIARAADRSSRHFDFAAGLTAFTFGVSRRARAALGRAASVARRAPAPLSAVGAALALGLAVINLVLFPFGTALGAYACWVLLTEEGRELFEYLCLPSRT